jgi:hypothetical protein
LQRQAEADIKAVIMASLGNIPSSFVKHPTNGVINLSVTQIWALLIQEYGNVRVTENSTVWDRLSIPYDQTESIITLIALHRASAEFHDSHAAPIPAWLQVLQLKRVVQHIDYLNDAILHYERQYNTIALQTFEELSKVLITASELHAQASTGRMGYTAAARQPPSSNRNRTFYCHTHGIECSHSSANCRFKNKGHQDSAFEPTRDNKGETRTFKVVMDEIRASKRLKN